MRNWKLVFLSMTTYIYIYIVIHRKKCFVASKLISVARHAGCFKLGWKPAQHCVILSIIPLCHQSTNFSTVFIRHYVVAFACLHFALPDTRVLNSHEVLCITRFAAVNLSPACSTSGVGSVYIVIHRQTVSLNQNSSVWLDTQDASSWDWNPANFTLDLVSYHSYIYIYIYIYIYSLYSNRLQRCCGLNSLDSYYDFQLLLSPFHALGIILSAQTITGITVIRMFFCFCYFKGKVQIFVYCCHFLLWSWSWYFTGFWVTARLLMSPELFSVSS